VELSTRFSILEQALADVVERLAELAAGPERELLRARAAQLESELARWKLRPPDEPTRVALLTRVLDLNVEVIRAGKPRPRSAIDTAQIDRDHPKKV
jgi:uncharacterized protein (DUF2384 family)